MDVRQVLVRLGLDSLINWLHVCTYVCIVLPSRLAPWTDAQAASPAANSPGTMALGFSLVGLITSPR